MGAINGILMGVDAVVGNGYRNEQKQHNVEY